MRGGRGVKGRKGQEANERDIEPEIVRAVLKGREREERLIGL